jgi:hypothetical protein
MLDQFSSTNPLYLGHVHISIDHEEFLDAIGYGLMSYFESEESEKRQMSTQELLENFKETIADTTPLPWRIGYMLGQFAGLLHPDLQDDDPCLTYLELLSQKCEKLYHASVKESRTAFLDGSVPCSSTFA